MIYEARMVEGLIIIVPMLKGKSNGRKGDSQDEKEYPHDK